MESVLNIYHFNKDKAFTEDESYELVNYFMAITNKAKNKINGLNSRLDYYKHLPLEADKIQVELNDEIQKWSQKIKRLGGNPLSLYRVTIPSSEGYFLWEYPKVELEFYQNQI